MLCLFPSVCVYLSHFDGHHMQILYNYSTQNCISVRSAGSMWYYAQFDWLLQNRYNQCLLNLNILLNLTGARGYINLETLMQFINEILFTLF
jgi:hypothetical protein